MNKLQASVFPSSARRGIAPLNDSFTASMTADDVETWISSAVIDRGCALARLRFADRR